MFHLNNRQEREPLDPELLEGLLQRAFALLDPPAGGVEIEIVDDVAIALLNEKFFSRPRPTNVISFPLQSESGPNGEGGPLGVVVVSVETIRREIAGLGYRLEEGLLYYMIHGLLHLLGYQHVGVPEAEAARMERRQDEIFEQVLAAGAGQAE